MINAELQSRYLRDPLPVRLGNLSSSLGRLARTIHDPSRRETADYMLDECKWFIEWTAGETDIEVAAQLVELQVTLAGWQRGLAGESRVPLDTAAAARLARESAEKVLQWSGLLD